MLIRRTDRRSAAVRNFIDYSIFEAETRPVGRVRNMTNLDWDDNEGPLAYLITFRTYGTWLHGDDRLSMDRHGKNIYRTPKVLPSRNLNAMMQENQASNHFLLDGPCRGVVERAIREVCSLRGYALHAINIRTNHAHSVVASILEKTSNQGRNPTCWEGAQHYAVSTLRTLATARVSASMANLNI